MDLPERLPPPLEDAFDPERFRALGHEAVDQLADYLKAVRRGNMPVLPWMEPGQATETWAEVLRGGLGDGGERAFMSEILEKAFHSHHPRNLGHQVGPVLPSAALFDFMASFLDTGNGVYEVGSPATPMERVVLQDLAKRIGWPDTADGILTSGGSLGNLTAMLAMRQCQADVWEKGTSAGIRCAVLVSSEAHYCADRAAKIMGWGDEGVVVVPVDEQFRLRASALAESLAAAGEQGLTVLGVVASAGSTATGRIDPLNEIADFCEAHELWLHVDAAHAGGYVYSRRAGKLLAGLERADSVVIDFHKMCLSPSLLTAVVFRRGHDSYEAFAQKAGYLWRVDQTEEWWDGAKRTLECTRPMLGLRAFAVLHVGGEAVLEAYIDRALHVTHRFADMVASANDFELLMRPESNILCYRYVPAGASEKALDSLNRKIRAAMVKEGRYYIVQVEKRGKTFLRSALMNPFVDEAVLHALLDEIRRVGKAVSEVSD